MQISGIVNPPSSNSASDGSQPIALMGKAGELEIAQLHGRYYTAAYRGLSYIGSTAGGGVTPPIYTTTAQTFGIWNPAGNSRNAALQTFDAGMVSGGTAVVSSFCLSQVLNAGSAVATGAPISAFNTVAPIASIVANAPANTVRFTPAGTTTTAANAAVFLMSLNFGFFSTTMLNNGPGCHFEFDEGVIVPPNIAVFVANDNAASSLVFYQTLRWSEPPL